MNDEILLGAMRRMGIRDPQPLLEPTAGETGSEQRQPAPPATAPKVLRIELAEDPAWRARVIKLDESRHESVCSLARWTEWMCRRCARNVREKGHQFVVVGGPGCGKTHAAKSFYRWVSTRSVAIWESGYWKGIPTVGFWDWPSLAEAQNWEERLVDIREADVVVLDDVGAETDRFKSGEGIERLRKTLNVCERKWLFVTTNIAREQWEARWDSRVASRLSAARFLDMADTPDFRPNLAKGAAKRA